MTEIRHGRLPPIERPSVLRRKKRRERATQFASSGRGVPNEAMGEGELVVSGAIALGAYRDE